MSPQPSGRPSAPQAAPPQTAMSPIPPPPVEPPPSPLEWLAARSLLDPPAGETSLPSRRRRTHDDEPADPAATPTMQRPAVPSSVRIDDRGSYRVAVPGSQPAAAPSEPTTQDNRLAEILAENGVTPATGGRRRRRYRDDGESDDVLARVLGRN
jgi:hypothetical protein